MRKIELPSEGPCAKAVLEGEYRCNVGAVNKKGLPSPFHVWSVTIGEALMYQLIKQEKSNDGD